MLNKKYIKALVLVTTFIGVGILSYYIFRDIKVRREVNQLKETLQNSPEKIESKHRLGLLYMYQKDFKRAEEEFLGILSMDPYNKRALTSIGMMYYQKGEPNRALTYWRSLLEVEPDNQFIWSLVNKISKADKGAAFSHEDIQGVNAEWERHYRQGQESYQKKDYKRAVEEFKKAAELGPADFRTYFHIGASYYAMKDLKEAKKNWETALKYKKDDLMTMRLISLAEKGIDRHGEVEAIQMFLKKDASDWRLHERLAEAYSKEKDKILDAEKEYLEVLRLSPSNFPTYFSLIELNIKLDDYDKAIHYANKLLKEKGDDDSSIKKKLDSLVAYKKIAEKGRERWAANGISPYSEMSPVMDKKTVLFYIDKYEVINAQYQTFLKATGYKTPLQWDDNKIKGKENYPVTGVSWYDAVMYCKWDGKRLPTEEEWIRAGWGGNRTNYPWGDNFGPDMANTAETTFDRPVPAGIYSPHNGIYDMIGNVMEWTSGEKAQPTTGEIYKIRKGGSFQTDPLAAISSAQWAAPPTLLDNNTGFRCAK